MTDSRELLKEYVRSRSELAFRELVERYVNLVYSVALRLANGDTHFAEDVTQTVFGDLAVMAPKLSEQVLLGGWLHQHTRFITTKILRAERRRRVRERQAVEMSSQPDHTRANLAGIAPILDEAIGQLSTPDRAAIILRYFEQHDLRSVGEALGTTEDAAQKRLTRALEKLHAILTHRGVSLSGAALGAALGTEDVTAAPAGLAASVATAALAGAPSAEAAITLAKLVAMITPQKTVLAVAAAALAATGIYHAGQAASLRAQVQVLQQRRAPLMQQMVSLQSERDDATNRLASLTDEIAKLRGNSSEVLKLRGQVARLRGQPSQASDPSVQTALTWQARKERLQRLFDERPDQRIPEMRFLTDQQWLGIAGNSDLTSDLTSEAGIGLAMTAVRLAAQRDAAPMVQAALKNFMEANAGNLPDNISELKPFFDPPLDEAILDRYKVLDPEQRQGWLAEAILVEKSVMDEAHAPVFVIWTNGGYSGTLWTNLTGGSLRKAPP